MRTLLQAFPKKNVKLQKQTHASFSSFTYTMKSLSKADIIAQYDPNGVGLADQLFGLPFDTHNADLVIIPVPWEVTVSYSAGTAYAPSDILAASTQVDLFDADIPRAWQLGIAMQEVDEEWMETSETLRQEAEEYILWLEEGSPQQDSAAYLQEIPEIINKEAHRLNEWVKDNALKVLKQGKMVALLGGDHSTPLGLMQALATQYASFGILQIDAHADLREAYEGFEFSHASIMYNALKIPQITKLVQVGIRDYCEEEAQFIHSQPERIHCFFDQALKEAQYQGSTWHQLCEQIIAQLPEHVYISFDIDGLDPKLCPHTGTPVPGGFDFHQIAYLLKLLVKSGKKIISFDLVEVCSPLEEEEWDANVGARLLYKLCNWMGVSQGKLKAL